MYSQACFYGSSCQAQLPGGRRFVFQNPFSLYFKSHKFKSVSTIDFIYFDDIVDFMIFHCLRGSKSNNALETGPRLKNDWLYYIFLFAFPFTFELCLVGWFSRSAFSISLKSLCLLCQARSSFKRQTLLKLCRISHHPYLFQGKQAETVVCVLKFTHL